MFKRIGSIVGPEELFGVLGFSSLVYGIWKLSHPAAFIAAGAILLTISALVVHSRTRKIAG